MQTNVNILETQHEVYDDVNQIFRKRALSDLDKFLLDQKRLLQQQLVRRQHPELRQDVLFFVQSLLHLVRF